MRRNLVIIFGCLFLGIPLLWGAEKKVTVDCGAWVEVSATPLEDYHFVKWSDGDTTAIRQIQVNEDGHYIAYFAPNCGEYANLPIAELYDWLLMLDVRTIHEMGYVFSEQNVTWYRVHGTPDVMDDTFPLDDEVVCHGYYLTIDRNLWTTGDYYAVVDVSSSPSGLLCTSLMRTYIAQYAGSKPKQRLALTPTYVAAGSQMKIIGLDPSVSSTICVYDMVGRMLLNTTSQNETTYYMHAANTPGCYNVVVHWGDEKQTLRYIVHTNK